MTDGFLLTKRLLAATLSGISLLPIPAPSIPVKNLPGGYSAVAYFLAVSMTAYDVCLPERDQRCGLGAPRSHRGAHRRHWMGCAIPAHGALTPP